MSRLGVFKNNEHVVVTTIIELTDAFFGGGGVGGERGPGGDGKAAVKRALEEYVKTASFVLLRLKMRHHYGGGEGSSSTPGFKFFCMYAFLDKFVEQCPQVSGRGRGWLLAALKHAERFVRRTCALVQ